jgi:hypothetical protein
LLAELCSSFHLFEVEEKFAFCPILLNLVRIARKFDERVFSMLTLELSTEGDVLDAVVVVVVVKDDDGGGVVNEVRGVVVDAVVVAVDVCSLSMRSFTSCLKKI